MLAFRKISEFAQEILCVDLVIVIRFTTAEDVVWKTLQNVIIVVVKIYSVLVASVD